MTEEEILLTKRLAELSRRASGGYFLFTDFLGLAELSALRGISGKLQSKYTLFGGAEGAERVMARFGDEEELGYSEPFPILCLKVEPKSEKFAERLSHRDFLGAILATGIERSVVGDIVIRDNVGYVFVKDSIAEYLTDSLTEIRRTAVRATVTEDIPTGELYKTEPRLVQTNGERLDGVIAKVFKLSRDDASSLFKKGLVFSDGREIASQSYIPKEGETVSVRGFGRFIYRGYDSLSRKGKKNITVEVFV